MEQTAKKRFPWLKLALVLSVVLNFLAIGVIWGMAARTGPSASLLRASVAALPAPERRALRRETSEIWRSARREGPSATAARTQMIAALQAEEFDPDAFSMALRLAQDRLLRISTQMHDRLLVTVSAMPLEDRRAYALALQEQLAKRSPRGPEPR